MPFIVIISGPMGVGKTTLAKSLHEKISRTALISYDEVKWLLSDFKSNDADFELTCRVEKAMIREYLSSGINVILEKAYTDSRLIDEIKLIADELAANSFIYQLEAPLEVAKDRVNKRSPSINRKAPPTAGKVERSYNRYQNSKHFKAKTFNSHNCTSEEICQQIISEIKEGKNEDN